VHAKQIQTTSVCALYHIQTRAKKKNKQSKPTKKKQNVQSLIVVFRIKKLNDKSFFLFLGYSVIGKEEKTNRVYKTKLSFGFV